MKRVFVVGLGLVMLGSQAAIAAPGRAPLASPNVNITRLGGNQSEAAIAIDPTDPSNVVEFSNRERGAGMVLAHSADGGATWDVSTFAQDDRFGRACCDPTLSWDGFGNLFMAWLNLEDSGAVPVALSTDGGQTFHMIKVLRPNPPTARAGADVVDIAAGRDEEEEDEGEKPGGGEKERTAVFHAPTLAARG